MGNAKNKKSRQGKLGGASSVTKRKGRVGEDEADVCKKKKSKTDVVDREEEGEMSEDDCDVVGDDEADEAPTNEEVREDEADGDGGIEEEGGRDGAPTNEEVREEEADGHGGIEEEGGRDGAQNNEEVREDEADGHGGIEEAGGGHLTVFFGELARTDDCENDQDSGDEWYWEHEKEVLDPLSSDDENEEQSIPSLAYREDVDPEAMLGLGNTFSTAEEFKHTLLRYTLKTRRNIKLYRSSSLKLGGKCEDSSCPSRVYCLLGLKSDKAKMASKISV
ncbi:DBD_Tnp_Mut domain-containing protein [Raphanus sativus]|nr:DBD_Tnp_Mut domain-containing protein [Raphanus sativus]